MTKRVIYECPVYGCSYSNRDENRFIGHMAGTMQYDEAHRWENVPIDHHDVSAAAKTVEYRDLEGFDP